MLGPSLGVTSWWLTWLPAAASELEGKSEVCDVQGVFL